MPGPVLGRETSSLLTIDFSVVALPLFITHCLSAELQPSWEVSTTTSDWISLFLVQAYKKVKHPQRSQLLSPMGAQSMLVLLAEGWNQLTALALPARAASAGSAGARGVTAHSLSQLCLGSQGLPPCCSSSTRRGPCPGLGLGGAEAPSACSRSLFLSLLPSLLYQEALSLFPEEVQPPFPLWAAEALKSWDGGSTTLMGDPGVQMCRVQPLCSGGPCLFTRAWGFCS